MARKRASSSAAAPPQSRRQVGHGKRAAAAARIQERRKVVREKLEDIFEEAGPLLSRVFSRVKSLDLVTVLVGGITETLEEGIAEGTVDKFALTDIEQLKALLEEMEALDFEEFETD